MNRRDFLLVTASVSLATPLAAGAEEVTYSATKLKTDLAAGKTVVLDFYATWCVTCAAQHRVMDKLKAQNPAYEDHITFMTVDWDTWKNGDLVRELKIPRRSTLVVLKGKKELDRLVAQTSEASIKALFDTALKAAEA